MITAASSGTRKVCRDSVITPSTTPMPMGVGETIVNKKAMLNPAMRVPTEKG